MHIENECQAVAKGAVLNRKLLDAAWQAKYENDMLQKEIDIRTNKRHIR